MKKWIFGVLMAVVLCGLTGCFEDDSKEKAKEVIFENQSRYTVNVISLTIEWGSFALAPGQRVKLKDIENVDYRYEPTWKVQEGSASTVRYIVFVDALPGIGG
jgi:hypothetical protein